MSVGNRIVLLVALFASAMLAGCGSSSSTSQTSPPPPPPPSVIPTTLSGTYVISYSGMDVTSNGSQSPFAMLGTITADGKGNLSGLIDLNDLDLIATTGAASGVQLGVKPTGTYTIGSDGRGTGTLNFTINSKTVSFGLDFVLISNSHGLITRFDSSGSGSGTIDLQPASVPANSFQSVSFALFGADSNGFPLASAGAIAVNSSGVVNGTQDFNENGTSTGFAGLTLSTATSNLTEVNGSGLNGTAELDSSFGLLSFEVWVVDQTHLKFIESDASGTVLSGDAFTQQATFPAGQLVFTLGGIGGGSRPFVAGGLLTTDASGNMNGFEDFNYSGSFTHVANVGASCTGFVAGRCQLAFTNFTNGTANNFQFAAYPTSGGILLLEIDSFGLAQGAAYAQTATSFAASQAYGLNLSGYNGGEVDDIAQFTVGASAISPGTLDEDDQGTTFGAEGLSGSYAPSAQVPGRGSISATVSGGKSQQATLSFEYYVIDSSTIAVIETDAAQVGVGTFQLQNISGATPLAQSHMSMVRPIIQPRAAHNNCPTFGTCPAPASSAQLWCIGNNSASTCAGGNAGIVFHTIPPAVATRPNPFEGVDAASIFATTSTGKNPGQEADPNGAVGPTDSNGVGQYLEFAGNFVQAFDKASGNGIFCCGLDGVSAAPQSLSALFSSATVSGVNICLGPSFDGIASYDRVDGAFVLANIFNVVDKVAMTSTYNLCIAVSTASASQPASNLEGAAWNAYAYSLTPAIPLNPNTPTNTTPTPYFPDYLRFGTWTDGFYVSWDLEDSFNNFNIVGFEVCQLDKADIISGLSSTPPQCYTYIPNYVVNTAEDRSLIHTLLPADFEGANLPPGTTAGEYFLALVNPRNPGTNVTCSTKAPCTSNQLAFWTWSGLTNGAPPTFLTMPTHAFTPGCYNANQPYNTFCVPEPYGGDIDGLGDRLAYRLAYRYITGTTNAEYLAVAHTIQENADQRTGIRYYKILAGTTPQTVLVGDIQDTTNFDYLSMPSVAMDKNGDLGITYTQTGNTTFGSVSDYDPSPFFVTVDSSGNQGTPVAILGSISGTTGQDETDTNWGEYVSVTTDPTDDLTFWAVDEYMKGDQLPPPSSCNIKEFNGVGCTWASIIFTCQKGSGC